MHRLASVGLVLFAFIGGASAAPSVTPIFTFDSTRGGQGALAADGAGNLYGALPEDGLHGKGLVYRLSPPIAPGGAWTETILYAFDGKLGSRPLGGVTLASDGALIVTAARAGPLDNGSVIRLVPTPSGAWTASMLYAFSGGDDGGVPEAAVIEDAAGNFFGSTYEGGKDRRGLIFELSPDGAGGYTETVLHAFTGHDGAGPVQPLVAASGDYLFGTTIAGGGLNGDCYGFYSGCGTAFSLARNASSPTGWTHQVVVRFNNVFPIGAFPSALTLHGQELVGAAQDAPVFALVPTGPAPVTLTQTTIYAFPTTPTRQAKRGSFPYGNIVTTPSGNLIGTAIKGGANGYGGLFELTDPAPGHPGTETLFYSYAPYPFEKSSIVVAPNGRLYQVAYSLMLEITPD